jgi:REP element-mobilizing transposase RayT
MPRRPRQLIEGGIYHVYNRVASGESIFSQHEAAVDFLELVREVKQRDEWTVFAWCLMSNHYHLLVRCGPVPLWRGMHFLHGTFGRRFNKRLRRTGSVWQSRYQAKLVDEGSYLGQVIQYIHLNPIKAGWTEILADNVYCGHREIVRRIRKPLIDVDDALLCFGTTSRRARRAYNNGIRVGIEEIRQQSAAEERAFHTLAWRDRELQAKPGQEHVDQLGRSTGRVRPFLKAGAYLEAACRELSVEKERLGDRSKDREIAEVRRLIVGLGVERWRQRCRGLAEALGKNPGVVSYWASEGARKRREDEGFARRFDELDGAMENALNPGRRVRPG